MTADVHPFTPPPEGEPADALPAEEPSSLDLMAERSVYLDAYLAPFKRWLDRDTVTEIMVNRPGEVWVEDAAEGGGFRKIVTPEIDDRLVQRLAEQPRAGAFARL